MHLIHEILPQKAKILNVYLLKLDVIYITEERHDWLLAYNFHGCTQRFVRRFSYVGCRIIDCLSPGNNNN